MFWWNIFEIIFNINIGWGRQEAEHAVSRQGDGRTQNDLLMSKHESWAHLSCSFSTASLTQSVSCSMSLQNTHQGWTQTRMRKIKSYLIYNTRFILKRISKCPLSHADISKIKFVSNPIWTVQLLSASSLLI